MTDQMKIRVKAGKNGPVHVERGGQLVGEDGKPIRTITESVVVVPNTQYYRRAITVGDLVVIEDKKVTKVIEDKEDKE